MGMNKKTRTNKKSQNSFLNQFSKSPITTAIGLIVGLFILAFVANFVSTSLGAISETSMFETNEATIEEGSISDNEAPWIHGDSDQEELGGNISQPSQDSVQTFPVNDGSVWSFNSFREWLKNLPNPRSSGGRVNPPSQPRAPSTPTLPEEDENIEDPEEIIEEEEDGVEDVLPYFGEFFIDGLFGIQDLTWVTDIFDNIFGTETENLNTTVDADLLKFILPLPVDEIEDPFASETPTSSVTDPLGEDDNVHGDREIGETFTDEEMRNIFLILKARGWNPSLQEFCGVISLHPDSVGCRAIYDTLRQDKHILFGNYRTLCQTVGMACGLEQNVRKRLQYVLDRLATSLDNPIGRGIQWGIRLVDGINIMSNNVTESIRPIIEVLYGALVQSSGQEGEVLESVSNSTSNKNGIRAKEAFRALTAFYSNPTTEIGKSQRLRAVQFALDLGIVGWTDRLDTLEYIPYTIEGTPTLYYAESGGYEFVGTWESVIKQFKNVDKLLRYRPNNGITIPTKDDAIVIDNQCDPFEWREQFEKTGGRPPFIFRYTNRVFASCTPNIYLMSDELATQLSRHPGVHTSWIRPITDKINTAFPILWKSKYSYSNTLLLSLYNGNRFGALDNRWGVHNLYDVTDNNTLDGYSSQIFGSKKYTLSASPVRGEGYNAEEFIYPAYWVRSASYYNIKANKNFSFLTNKPTTPGYTTNLVHNVVLTDDFLENPYSLEVRPGDTIRFIVEDPKKIVQLVSIPTDCNISDDRVWAKPLDKDNLKECHLSDGWAEWAKEYYYSHQAIGAWIYGSSSEAVRPLYEVEGVAVTPYKHIFEYKVDGRTNDLIYLQVLRTSKGKSVFNLGTQLGTEAFLLDRYYQFSSPRIYLNLLPRTLVTEKNKLKIYDIEIKRRQNIITEVQNIIEQDEGPSEEEEEEDLELSWPTASHKISDGGYFQDSDYPWRKYGLEHTGIDIQSNQGFPLSSAGDGVVIKAQDGGDDFSYILIRHDNGLYTLYGHVLEIQVAEGQRVLAGEQIGLSGGEPGTPGAGSITTGPHLHFEVWDADRKLVDPLLYLP